MGGAKECIAMLLAGGEGRRLGALTRHQAKPALPFGTGYRIIDFTLSNCSNSGIQTVGVLTQYQPQSLHSHLGNGSPWNLDLSLLPPFASGKGEIAYKGTANAVYHNIPFIEQYLPRYVLVVSGDHIYKMDYSLLLNYHKVKGADVTLATVPVPWNQASRFGIVKAGENGQVMEFQEKPKTPRSNLASMGVYIFSREIFLRYLQKDAENDLSSNDFGKDVIPAMLRDGCRMFAYPFQGYWRDIGTPESLWEANMELLSRKPPLDLHDPYWPIYSVKPELPPCQVASTARVENALIGRGCRVLGQVYHSILSAGVYVGEGAVIKNSMIMPGVKIGRGSYINGAVMNEHVTLVKGIRFMVPTMAR